MNYMKKGLIAAGMLGILSIAAPAFAQSYGGGYNSYNPQSSYGYGTSYGSPINYQPTYINNGYPSSYGQTQVQMPSYNYAPTYQQSYYPQQNYSQQYYPQQNYGSQNAQQYYPYTNTYPNANSYPMYNVSQPAYDPTYTSFSNYYTQYPHKVGVYTGNTDLFGTPLCNWPGGYQGYDCGSDPSQPVYDP